MTIPTQPLQLSPTQTLILQRLDQGAAPIDQLVREMRANSTGAEKDIIEALMRRQESYRAQVAARVGGNTEGRPFRDLMAGL